MQQDGWAHVLQQQTEHPQRKPFPCATRCRMVRMHVWGLEGAVSSTHRPVTSAASMRSPSQPVGSGPCHAAITALSGFAPRSADKTPVTPCARCSNRRKHCLHQALSRLCTAVRLRTVNALAPPGWSKRSTFRANQAPKWFQKVVPLLVWVLPESVEDRPRPCSSSRSAR